MSSNPGPSSRRSPPPQHQQQHGYSQGHPHSRGRMPHGPYSTPQPVASSTFETQQPALFKQFHHAPAHQRQTPGAATMSHHQPQPSPVLKVMDMGLDFRSYGQFVDPKGEPLLGNVVEYAPGKLTEHFEPTIGLLVTVLHLYHHSITVRDAPVWLLAYQAIQSKISVMFAERRPEVARYADEAIKAIAAGSFSTNGADPKLVEKLFILLDGQSGQRGGQCPSQRPIPAQPKGMFCNLHLSDHTCNQEFSCNQLHLVLPPGGQPVKHRVEFHMQLIDALLSRGVQLVEIQHRVKDSLFYAKFGNKVTVPYGGQWIPFFRTLFSGDRLAHALRMLPPTAPSQILVHNEGRTPGLSKVMELPNPKDALAEVEMSAAMMFQVYEHQHASATQSQQSPLPVAGDKPHVTDAQLSSSSISVPSADSHEAGDRGAEVASPTGEGWTAAIRSYMRDHGASETRATEALLQQLSSAARPTGTTPVTPEGFTPLLQEVEMMRFDSESSLEGSSPSRR